VDILERWPPHAPLWKSFRTFFSSFYGEAMMEYSIFPPVIEDISYEEISRGLMVDIHDDHLRER
jgi:hypothetical protein